MLRAELIIAALALITSACASIAAIFQTHEAIVQTNETRAQTDTLVRQLGTSIWPYLTMGYSYISSPGTVVYSVTNEGLGPALIKSFSISLDGRRVSDAGSVLRPSQSTNIFKISDTRLKIERARDVVIPRIAMSACYCSLLDDCWTLRSGENEPVKIAHCGPPSRIVYSH